MNRLEELRKEINSCDEEMIKLFKKRMDAVREVILYKIENNLDILDLKREEEIIKRNLAILNNSELEKYYIEVFNSILSSSKEYQADIRKAIK